MIRNTFIIIRCYIALLSILLFFGACQKQKVYRFKHYLHLSHLRTGDNNHFDSLVTQIDYQVFDMLLLGGDLAYATSIDDATMNRVDQLFDLSNPNTLWSLGNHDGYDLNRIEQYTGRPAYYHFHQDGITFIVLNTQDSFSNIVNDQKEFLFSVLDTIEASSHLIIMHHKLFWLYDHPELSTQLASISNADLGNCFYCLNPNNFNEEIYPALVAIKQRDIEVICLGGDLGYYVKQFEYLSPEGIHFLASGIDSNQPGNNALLFQHDLDKRILKWLFVPLEELISNRRI